MSDMEMESLQDNAPNLELQDRGKGKELEAQHGPCSNEGSNTHSCVQVFIPNQSFEDSCLALLSHHEDTSQETQDIVPPEPYGATDGNDSVQAFRLKKFVSHHSEYPISPFDLVYGHEDVPRIKKLKVYRWLTQANMPQQTLARPWFHLNYPWTISICGYVLRSCICVSGSFNIDLCDAIMRVWTYLDRKMYNAYVKYGEIHKQWRHFLPASFALTSFYPQQSILCQEDYLQSEKIRSSFIGDHLHYHVENCRMFIMPVKYHDKWSCYFWDMKLKKLIVMDPCRMNLSSVIVSLQHEQAVLDIHKALITCINHFFDGWSVDESGWTFCFPTHHGPRCLHANSGLYAVHYARAFDGVNTVHYPVKDPCEANLSEARAEILYWLFMIAGNCGYYPEDLFEDLGIFI